MGEENRTATAYQGNSNIKIPSAQFPWIQGSNGSRMLVKATKQTEVYRKAVLVMSIVSISIGSNIKKHYILTSMPLRVVQFRYISPKLQY